MVQTETNSFCFIIHFLHNFFTLDHWRRNASASYAAAVVASFSAAIGLKSYSHATHFVSRKNDTSLHMSLHASLHTSRLGANAADANASGANAVDLIHRAANANDTSYHERACIVTHSEEEVELVVAFPKAQACIRFFGHIVPTVEQSACQILNADLASAHS